MTFEINASRGATNPYTLTFVIGAEDNMSDYTVEFWREVRSNSWIKDATYPGAVTGSTGLTFVTGLQFTLAMDNAYTSPLGNKKHSVQLWVKNPDTGEEYEPINGILNIKPGAKAT